MKNLLNRLFSMPLMGLAMLIFFVAIGYATFVENDFGTPVAQKLIYRARWFEIVILYLFLSMIWNIYKYKMIQMKKFGALTFHLAFIVIIIGAAFTRYYGFEGVMRIRENSASNEIISAETYFQVKVHDSIQQYVYDMPLILEEGTDNYFEHTFLFPGEKKETSFQFVDLMENVKDTLIPTSKKEGDPYVEIVTVGKEGRQYNYLRSGEVLTDVGFKIAFNNNDFTDAIRITETDTGIYVLSPFDLSYLQMSDQSEGVVVRDSFQEFYTKRLYSIGQQSFVFNAYYPAAKIDVVEDKSEPEVDVKAVTIKTTQGELSKEVVLRGGKGMMANRTKFTMGNLHYELAFGSKVVQLPFSLYLRDFQLDRYPGTMNPSSYAAEVTILDMEQGVQEDHRIFMNNVLDYRGFRFFQSSYDPDEHGTILSVNQDRLGTITTYIGYLLLGLGFIINLFSRGSRFRLLMNKAKELRLKRETLQALVLLLGLAFSNTAFSQVEADVVDAEHAENYGRLVVQDQGGRFKPVHTMANDILKKVNRSDSYEGLSAMQVFLGIHTDAIKWQLEPIIYVSGSDLREKLHFEGKRAALADFFNLEYDTYLLAEDAEKARRKKPAEQSQYDKDVLKTDERVNIVFGLFTGMYLKIMPLPGDSTNTWYSPFDPDAPFEGEDRDFFNSIVPLYNSSVKKGVETGDWTLANEMIKVIDTYQRRVAPKDLLPSKSKIDLEISYNELDIFKRLMNGYITFGLLLLIIQFFKIFRPQTNLKWISGVGYWVFLLMFVAHGIGLGLRWYLSGHAPWSNGYEAVVFIAFITVAAGLLFSSKNKIVLGATGILAWLMLFVAHMNALDPEITNLVPVLKSYWLMIHVAIITGSYGFLGLGAILGLIILVMNLFLTQGNKKRILMTTKELTYVSEMTITVGLFMLTIGTFLGGVWANESWGRYWGWDAKETWALASVIVYAIILHLRFIPFLKSQFAFNTASLWGYASIIMTFFGVNFYLSGLHSYAQGDPIPVPTWVPVTVILLIILNGLSYIFYKRAVGKEKADPESESA